MLDIVGWLKKLVVSFGGASDVKDVKGNTITEVLEKLNKAVEEGGGGGGSSRFDIKVVVGDDLDTVESQDKTYAQIKAAYDAGNELYAIIVVEDEDDGETVEIPMFSIPLSAFSVDDETFEFATNTLGNIDGFVHLTIGKNSSSVKQERIKALPDYSYIDEGKILSVDDNGDPAWVAPPALVVTLTEDPNDQTKLVGDKTSQQMFDALQQGKVVTGVVGEGGVGTIAFQLLAALQLSSPTAVTFFIPDVGSASLLAINRDLADPFWIDA